MNRNDNSFKSDSTMNYRYLNKLAFNYIALNNYSSLYKF